jgi:cytochrome c-type biogenesis protein
MEVLAELGTAFVLGLLTPLGAVCVLPLYPGFLVYLSSQLSGKEAGRLTILLFGLIITAGVIIFMFLLGIIFTTLLQVSLTNIVEIASPIAFGILLIISLLLIITSLLSLIFKVDVDVGRFLPKGRVPIARNPWASAFIYGFFFGAIVVPCNPAFIAVLFTTTATGIDFALNIARFVFFGIGIGFPLIVIAAISSTATDAIMNFLAKSLVKDIIYLVAGLIMLGISLYYLISVFRVFGAVFG